MASSSSAAQLVQQVSKPIFLYFRFAGRAFGPRVSLFNTFGKDGWVDERVGPSDFKKLKKEFTDAAEDNKSAVRLQTANVPQLEISTDGLQNVTAVSSFTSISFTTTTRVDRISTSTTVVRCKSQKIEIDQQLR